jgi:hypothetical protein
VADQAGKAGLPGADQRRADQQEQRRLDEGGERGLARRAHALEGAADVHRREHQEQPRQPQRVGEDDEVVRELQRRQRPEHRRDLRGQQRRGQHHPGAGAEQRRATC